MTSYTDSKRKEANEKVLLILCRYLSSLYNPGRIRELAERLRGAKDYGVIIQILEDNAGSLRLHKNTAWLPETVAQSIADSYKEGC